MITMIELECDNCGKHFERKLSNHKSNKKKTLHNFCSLSCAAIWRNKNDPVFGGNFRNFGDNIGHKCDEFSPFRRYLRTIKGRNKKHNVTLQDLKDQWNRQGGICPYTGWKLEMPANSGAIAKKGLIRATNLASVDRIDSSRGYMVGNVQFVALIANCAKSVYTETQLIEFCKAVAERF